MSFGADRMSEAPEPVQSEVVKNLGLDRETVTAA